MKKSVPITPFWYSDKVVWPKVAVIITTLNKDGVPNAAPLSTIMHYDIMDKTPRVMIGMRKFAHTIQNIVATGEFVVNFPPFTHTDDIIEACRFYPEGVNELDFMNFTPIDSQTVKPPTLSECKQVFECTLDKYYELDKTQAHVIGNVERIMIDEDLLELERIELSHKIDPTITLGDAGKRYFHWTRVSEVNVFELKEPPAEDEIRYAVKRSLDWEEGALKALDFVPKFVLPMVVEMAEKIVKDEGSKTMTAERFNRLIEEYTPEKLMDRLDTH